jgi:hypothetical protein
MSIRKVDNQVVSLAVSQVVTGSWADLSTVVNGPLFNAMDCLAVSLWLKVDINDSVNLRFRVLAAQSDSATDFYSFPIESATATVVDVSPEYKELTVDADQNIILPIASSDNFPFLKVQVMAGTPGASPATITAGLSFTSNLTGSQ